MMMNSLYLSCGLLAGSIKQDNNPHKPIMAIIPNSALVLAFVKVRHFDPSFVFIYLRDLAQHKT